MKKVILNVIICIIVCFVLAGCTISNKEVANGAPDNIVENIQVTEYYKDDDSINLFINKYNDQLDPDITIDMITKKHIAGRDRDDVVKISNNEKLEIVFYGGKKYNNKYSMEVFIGYKNGTGYTNEDFKNEFIKYVKLIDDSLSDDTINTYWNDMISEHRSNYKINEIDVWPNVFNGKVEYLKISFEIKF